MLRSLVQRPITCVITDLVLEPGFLNPCPTFFPPHKTEIAGWSLPRGVHIPDRSHCQDTTADRAGPELYNLAASLLQSRTQESDSDRRV